MSGKDDNVGLNDNGRLPLQLCCKNALFVTNAFFQNRNVHKYTRCRGSLGERLLNDFCMV